MLGYGLLERSVSMLICYQNPEGEVLNAEVPVFPVGLGQLCDMFGLLGHDKTRANNRHNPFFVKPVSGCYVIVSGATSPGDYNYIRGVFFHDSYDNISYCVDTLRDYLEVDAEEPYFYQPATTQYEIWQVCDDDELWHDWNLEADLYCYEKWYDNWLAEVSDGPHYYPTVVHEPELMSEDYLSSLKTANASGSERCYYCGLPLSRPYTHAMEVNGTVELVCGSCFLAHSDHSLGDCFMQVLRGLEDC